MVYTGDIHAMWLRDSSAQVFPHIQFANDDPKVKTMLAGVINPPNLVYQHRPVC